MRRLALFGVVAVEDGLQVHLSKLLDVDGDLVALLSFNKEPTRIQLPLGVKALVEAEAHRIVEHLLALADDGILYIIVAQKPWRLFTGTACVSNDFHQSLLVVLRHLRVTHVRKCNARGSKCSEEK
eukprot:5008368-Prymnesium_polylepis.1